MSSSSRRDELYRMGMEKYNEVVDLELGTNNALIAAMAVMLADSEKTRTWKTPALIGDPVDTWEDEATANYRAPVTSAQLALGDW